MKLCVFVFSISILALLSLPAISQEHAFSVKDDIAMIRFSDPRLDPNIPGSDTAVPSPDGRHVAIVTTKGLLDRDRIESMILVFDLEKVSIALDHKDAPTPLPRVVATIVSYPHHEEPDAYAPVIKYLRWSKDGSSLYFKGENANGAYQLFITKPDGSGFHPLTPPDMSVGRFDIGDHGIAYTASRPDRDPAAAPDPINADAQVATGYRIHDIIFPGQLTWVAPENFTLSVADAAHGRANAKRVPNYAVREIPALSYVFPFQLSPKGHQLIGVTPLATIPTSWSQYDPIQGYEHLRLTHGGDSRLGRTDNILRPQQYTLIDTITGKESALVDAPVARGLGYFRDNSRLAWSSDERRVLLTNTFLRLDRDHSERTRPCAVVSVDLPSLFERCLFFEESAPTRATAHVQDVTFGEDDSIAIVLTKTDSDRETVRTYQLRDTSWQEISSKGLRSPVKTLSEVERSPEQPATLRVFVKQDLDQPPTLWASNESTGARRKLWDPNPQLKAMTFGEASLYDWHDASGREWSGILVKPVNYVSGKQYPLVLQMYSFVPNEFLTDGLFPSAFAARHLASAGFVVLQIKKKPDTLSEADPQIHLEGYRSAVDSLAEAGMIDRHRVGVVGFSWTCWYVLNALIKDPTLFQAATISDGLDNSYMQYMLFGLGSYQLQYQFDRIRGTSPFGEGLKTWVHDAPGFHMEQVQAPLRIEANGPSTVLQEWEVYSSLRLQHKPVDLIYFRKGFHIHQKPLERLESQQGNVDWLRFWLQGYEDPDPAKHRQYERWEEIRSASSAHLQP